MTTTTTALTVDQMELLPDLATVTDRKGVAWEKDGVSWHKEGEDLKYRPYRSLKSKTLHVLYGPLTLKS